VTRVSVEAAVTLRPMRWWDIEAVSALEREVFDATAWSAELFWSELVGVPETHWYLVAEVLGVPDEPAIVGYAGLSCSGTDADVQTLAVAQAHRGHGVGAALLDGLLDRATDRGCRRVFLEVAADAEAARALYASRSFSVIDIRRDYYGPGADALVMRASLPRPPEQR
jgi:ribosomal-protein-alanine N-acetyltransferase